MCITYKVSRNKPYLEFIRYSLNPKDELLKNVAKIDWEGFFQFACDQAIAGVVFEGVKKLSEHQSKPPFNLLMEWIGLTEQIAKQNKILNRRCVEVVREYQEAGFECCVLKGQGNAAMYPNPFSRASGDIDLWIFGPAKKTEKTEIIKYVRERHPEKIEDVRYYHVGYADKGIEVEVHFMPNIMNNPVYHRRLQKWYKKMADGGILKEDVELPEGVGSIPVPTAEFNIVFQLAHMMHHFFDEGIGLRQFVDYYYVLMSDVRGIRNATLCCAEKMSDVSDTLRYLGLWNFAGAVMYVMQEVFHLDKAYMIAPVDERRGKTLMAEILKGGNFGQHSGLTNHSTGGKYLAKTLRNLHFIREYPAEALCEPIFRTWHFFWRQWQKHA